MVTERNDLFIVFINIQTKAIMWLIRQFIFSSNSLQSALHTLKSIGIQEYTTMVSLARVQPVQD